MSKRDTKVHDVQPATLSPWTAVGALCVVVALILVLARVFRKHAPMFQQGLPPEALEVLGRRFVDQRQSIVLVRIASRILVVGSSPSGLQPLGELADPVEVDLVAGLCRSDSNLKGIGTSFLRMLKGQTAQQHPTAAPRARRTPVASTAAQAAPETSPYEDRSASDLEMRRRLRAAANSRLVESSEGVR